jgi:type IV pilus assembly protein PilX
MKHRIPSFTRSDRHQSGVALVVVLLFMATLAVGGLYSARSALLGEQLARNQLDIQVARQAAEAALRDAEVDLSLPGGVDPTGSTCSRGALRPIDNAYAAFQPDCPGGQCRAPSYSALLALDYVKAGGDTTKGSEAWWPNDKGGLWSNDNDKKTTGKCATFKGAVPIGTYTGAREIPAVARQPEYLIEAIDKNGRDVFRITARGFGFRTGTEVVLQSYFMVPKL